MLERHSSFFLCLALNLSNPSSLHFLFKHAPQSDILTFSHINHPVLISTGSPGLWWNVLILLCVSLPCSALFYFKWVRSFFGVFFSEWFLISLREFPSSSMSSCVLRSCWTAIILWIGENNGGYPLYAVSLKWGGCSCCEESVSHGFLHKLLRNRNMNTNMLWNCEYFFLNWLLFGWIHLLLQHLHWANALCRTWLSASTIYFFLSILHMCTAIRGITAEWRQKCHFCSCWSPFTPLDICPWSSSSLRLLLHLYFFFSSWLSARWATELKTNELGDETQGEEVQRVGVKIFEKGSLKSRLSRRVWKWKIVSVGAVERFKVAKCHERV